MTRPVIISGPPRNPSPHEYLDEAIARLNEEIKIVKAVIIKPEVE